MGVQLMSDVGFFDGFKHRRLMVVGEGDQEPDVVSDVIPKDSQNGIEDVLLSGS